MKKEEKDEAEEVEKTASNPIQRAMDNVNSYEAKGGSFKYLKREEMLEYWAAVFKQEEGGEII